MKLRLKIFISILLVSLSTLLISTYYVINRSHIDNIKREQDRSLNEFELIKLSVRNSVDITTTASETVRAVFSRFAEYYSERDIALMLYQNDRYLYNNFEYLPSSEYEDLLQVQEHAKLVHVLGKDKTSHMFVSGSISENSVLIYARDISDIYQARSQSIRLSFYLAGLLVVLLGLLSYLYSRWITKPIVSLQKGATGISKGDYSVRMKETKDEFNTLTKAFNNMASAVENRTIELQEKAEELQVFIDDLSHEMNTPLTSIQGYAQFLENANANEEQRITAAMHIRTQAERMKDIYTKLMALSFAREHDIEPVIVNTYDLFQDIQDTFYHQFQVNQVLFQNKIQLPSFYIDRTLIHMLLCNLVKNSLQAMPKGGQLILRAYEDNKKPVLEVSDTGFGIPADKINEVIKPFFRVDKSRSRKTGGAGLGLSICRNIAKLHHAELKIESKEGEGTTVKLIFQTEAYNINTVRQ